MHVGKERCVPGTVRLHANLNVMSKEKNQLLVIIKSLHCNRYCIHTKADFRK